MKGGFDGHVREMRQPGTSAARTGAAMYPLLADTFTHRHVRYKH